MLLRERQMKLFIDSGNLKEIESLVPLGIMPWALGYAGVRALMAVSPAGLPRVGENGGAIGLDWTVLGFTLVVSVLTGVLFGLFPAFTASRTDLNTSLKESSGRAGTGFRQGKSRARA